MNRARTDAAAVRACAIYDLTSRCLAALMMVLCLLPMPAQAQLRSETVASGLSQPLGFVPDPAFSNIFYIIEQGGLVRVLRDGDLQDEPFADLRGLTRAGGEQGLLGMAFDPDVWSGRVFFNYTDINGDTVIARFHRTVAAPFRIDLSSRLDLRWPTGERVIRQPFDNHNGGYLTFGPDGYLYIGLGDGGSGNDPLNNAQDPASLLGKMLRLNVNVPDADETGYRVPADNPFVDGHPIAAMGEIWSFGLRNPWRYSFDDLGTGATGALLIGDVGQASREEINYEPPGAGGRNYGWRLREGRIATPGVPATPPAYEPLTDPLVDYARVNGRSVTGGFVYRGEALRDAYRGRYFVADFSTSRVWSLGLAVDPAGEATVTDVVEHTSELGPLSGVASFGRDLHGELYVVTFAGRVLKIVPDTGGAPAAPQDARASVTGSTVVITWTASATGPRPSAYQLEAGSIPGGSDVGVVTTSGDQTTLTFTDTPPGTYYARLRGVNAGGASAPSDELVVVVSGGGCSVAPSAPTAFAPSIVGRSVTLSWDAVSGANAPTSVVIEAGDAAGTANRAVLTADGGLRALTVDAPPGQYFVRIRGRNACGTGTASNEIVVEVF